MAVTLTQFTDDLNIIAALSDQPNDSDGLDADQLKAKFDESSILIQNYINTVFIPELEEAITNAAAGITQNGISGSVLSEGSVTADKLNHTSGLEAVTTNTIRDLAVTTAKIALQAITTALIADRAVTQQKIALLGVGTPELANKAVTTAKLADGAVSEIKMDSTYKSTIQTVHKTATATLASGASTWDVTVEGVTTGNTIICAPNPTDENSVTEWGGCGVRCSAQYTGRLAFTADTETENPITVNVLILDKN